MDLLHPLRLQFHLHQNAISHCVQVLANLHVVQPHFRVCFGKEGKTIYLFFFLSLGDCCFTAPNTGLCTPDPTNTFFGYPTACLGFCPFNFGGSNNCGGCGIQCGGKTPHCCPGKRKKKDHQIMTSLFFFSQKNHRRSHQCL